MIPENIQVSTLSNGLTLITINQPWNQGIYCNAFVKVGSCDEQLERDKGICHFIEHMVFKGTEDYTQEQMTQMMTGRGGYFNAATSFEYTKYDLWTQKEFLADTMSILDNLVFKPIINNEHINIEKQIITEEAMQQKSNPSNQADFNISSLLYPNHNIKYPIIGTEDSINNITSTRMKEYLRGYYRPQTIILTLCGALPEQAELEEILYNQAHGFIRKTRASNSTVLKRNYGTFEIPQQDHFIEEVWEDIKTSISITTYVFDSKEFHKKESVALSILINLIGGDMNSLMFKQIREQKGLCYSCGAEKYSLMEDDLGECSFSIYGRRAKIDKAEKELDKILTNVAKGEIKTEDIEYSKNSLIGASLRGFESGKNFSSFLTYAYLNPNEENRVFPWEYAELIKNTEKSQIIEIAQQILNNPKGRSRVLNKND